MSWVGGAGRWILRLVQVGWRLQLVDSVPSGISSLGPTKSTASIMRDDMESSGVLGGGVGSAARGRFCGLELRIFVASASNRFARLEDSIRTGMSEAVDLVSHRESGSLLSARNRSIVGNIPDMPQNCPISCEQNALRLTRSD